MKKNICIIIAALGIFYSLNCWSADRNDPVSQRKIAGMIGERLGYDEGDCKAIMSNLKKIGITPLGDWDEESCEPGAEEKPLTKEDFDAILIRMARRDPVTENMEPAKLLDSMGFPPRGVSQGEVDRIFASDVFNRIIINSQLMLTGSLIPLPSKYTALLVIKEGLITTEIALAAAAEEPVVSTEVTPPPIDPPDPHDT